MYPSIKKKKPKKSLFFKKDPVRIIVLYISMEMWYYCDKTSVFTSGS